MARGLRLTRHFRTNHRTSFVFPAEAAGIAGDFLTGSVAALPFVSAIRICKGLVHQGEAA